MTGWHWALAVPPLGLAVLAAVGALLRNRRGEIGGWLSLAIVLLAGSELHDSLWPSAYGNSVLMNTADVLRLAMAAVVVVGGTLELRRIASERAALLAAEKERARHLEEVASLKADFTAMVAHELGYPLSAIRLRSRSPVCPRRVARPGGQCRRVDPRRGSARSRTRLRKAGR